MHRRTALVIVFVSAACYATLAVLAVLAYESGARPLPLLTWRFGIAAILMAGYLAVRRPSELLGGLRHIHRYAALSLTGYGAGSLCFFFALQHASASLVAVLLYTYPAMVSLAGVLLFGERFTTRTVAALALTFVGCALALGVSGPEVHAETVGVLLGLGAAAGYSAFTVLSSRLVGRSGRLVLMTYTFAIAAAGIAVVALIAGESLSPVGWPTRLWLLLGAIVVVPTFLAVVLYLQGVRVLGPSRAAIASTAEPVFTIALAVFVLGDRLEPGQLLGAALVVAGIVVAERSTAGHTEAVPPS